MMAAPAAFGGDDQASEAGSDFQSKLEVLRAEMMEMIERVRADSEQAVEALNGRIDFTNKDLAATQESAHTTQNSLSDCFNEVAVVRSDLERNIADTEARLKNDIRQKQAEAYDKIGAVEQQAEKLSRVNRGDGPAADAASVESVAIDVQKNTDAIIKLERARNMDEQNYKAQFDAVHDVLDTKVNEKPYEDLKHCVESLTKGTVKFARVLGVPADVELLGWEEAAENLDFFVEKFKNEGTILTTSFSPDGQLLAYGGHDKQVTVVSSETWEPVHNTIANDTICTTTFSPDGKLFAFGGYDKAVTVLSTDTWDEVWSKHMKASDPQPSQSEMQPLQLPEQE